MILPRTSEGLYLLQRVRDEAHRFAITHHRKRRSKSMIDSTLDAVPGLGEVRRKALMRHFGSVRKLRAATVGRDRGRSRVSVLAPPQAVVDALAAAGGGAPAVNMATGEIIDGRPGRARGLTMSDSRTSTRASRW